MKKYFLVLFLLAAANKPTIEIIEYGTTWCPACQTMNEALRQEKIRNRELVIHFIDLEHSSRPNLPIRFIPYMIVKKDGVIVFEGNNSPEGILDLVRKHSSPNVGRSN